MQKIKTLFFLLLTCSTFHVVQAQTEIKKFTLNGMARTLSFMDNLSQDLSEADTVTAPKSLASHTLVDLGMKVRPGENIEIQSMVRIRNDFGGFWGSGVTFDVRELYVKGVIKNIVRYQVGDINYKLTPYTFYNSDAELSSFTPAVFSHLSDQIDYDNFFSDDNTWRQQGASVDFGIIIKKYIQEINWNLFTSRIAATNGSTSPDRLFSAANMTVLQSKYFNIGLNYSNLYDFAGTAATDQQLKNPVTTVNANAEYIISDLKFNLSAETGVSNMEILNDSLAPVLSDNFFDTKLTAEYTPWKIGIYLRLKSVGADFRSPGAQTKRINFESFPASFERITNDQILRGFTSFDLLRESELYNLQLQNGLMDFNPGYDNITPYGDATPNRQGFETGLNWAGWKESVQLNFAFISQTEIRGQGTLVKREFNRMNAGAEIAIGKLLKSKKSIVLNADIRRDQTSRKGEAGVPDVDFNTDIISVGLSAEIISHLELCAGIQNHAYSGFEFSNQVNLYDEIINFTEYYANAEQRIWGAGARWNFSEKTYLMGQFNQFSLNNSNLLDVTPDYTINNFTLIYSMKF